VPNDAARGGRIQSAVSRYLGPPLGKDAPKVQRLRRVRTVGLKIALPFLPLVIIAVITIDQVWAYALFTAWALVWLGSMANLSRDIRRAR
jgi:hypothetical protein